MLAGRHASGAMSALVIDEAQCLPDELLEEVRLLANIESASEKLLSIVLAGQPEIADRLNQPSLRQLKQRIGLRCSLAALELPETAAYIAARLRIAGGDGSPVFTDDAVATIHDDPAGFRARSASSPTTRSSALRAGSAAGRSRRGARGLPRFRFRRRRRRFATGLAI